MKLQLYSFGESGHSYKVALALHFSKANWEQIFIDFFHGEARSEAYKNEINRMAEVPVLVYGDKKISQSGAILDYLNGKTGNYFGRMMRNALRFYAGSCGTTRGYLAASDLHDF